MLEWPSCIALLSNCHGRPRSIWQTVIGTTSDAGQPTLTSCDVEHQAIFTLPRKVDSFQAYDSIDLHVNGMLFDPNALCVARNPISYMMTRGDAKGVMDDNTTKTEAWKRRRNRRHDEKMAKDVFESNTTKTEAWKRRRNRRRNIKHMEEGREEETPGAAGTKPGTHTRICTRSPRSSRYHCRYGTGPLESSQ